MVDAEPTYSTPKCLKYVDMTFAQLSWRCVFVVGDERCIIKSRLVSKLVVFFNLNIN